MLSCIPIHIIEPTVGVILAILLPDITELVDHVTKENRARNLRKYRLIIE